VAWKAVELQALLSIMSWSWDGGSECKCPERALRVRRRRRQYDVVFVDQVSAVIPVLHLLTRSKVRPACVCNYD